MSADPDNLICVCYTHHIGGYNAKEPSFHANPMEMADWWQENNQELHKELRERTRTSHVCDLYFWQQKEIELDEELKKYV